MIDRGAPVPSSLERHAFLAARTVILVALLIGAVSLARSLVVMPEVIRSTLISFAVDFGPAAIVAVFLYRKRGREHPILVIAAVLVALGSIEPALWHLEGLVSAL